MVKIRLLSELKTEDELEGFLRLEPYLDGYTLVVTSRDGKMVSAPYVLFIEPDPETGRIALSLASSVNEDYVVRSESKTSFGTIKINTAH